MSGLWLLDVDAVRGHASGSMGCAGGSLSMCEPAIARALSSRQRANLSVQIIEGGKGGKLWLGYLFSVSVQIRSALLLVGRASAWRGGGSVDHGLVCAQAVDTGARREHAATHERVVHERQVRASRHGRKGAERA
eukprot:scaffold89702_cov66-Phaeocystis_antarctica.AAC.1